MPAPAGTRTVAGMIELPAIKRFAWRTRTGVSPPSSCRIARFALADSPCPPVLTTPGASPQTLCIWQLVDHIDAHLSEALSVDQLARGVGLSRARLISCFEQEMGETPGEFIRRLRLERAANFLLHDRSTPLLDIALACGFQSAAVFSRAFHDWFARSPTVWRQGEHWRRCGQGMCWRPRCGECRPVDPAYADTPQLQAMRQHPFARGKPDSIRLDAARQITLPDLDMVYLRGLNTSGIGCWLPLWQRWQAWAAAQPGLPIGSHGVALQHLDNANICPPRRSRADVGLFIDRATPTPPGLGRKAITGGPYLLVPFYGNWLDEVLAHEYGWLTAFAAMGLRFDMHRASFKLFPHAPAQPPGLSDFAAGEPFAMHYAFAISP